MKPDFVLGVGAALVFGPWLLAALLGTPQATPPLCPHGSLPANCPTCGEWIVEVTA